MTNSAKNSKRWLIALAIVCPTLGWWIVKRHRPFFELSFRRNSASTECYDLKISKIRTWSGIELRYEFFQDNSEVEEGQFSIEDSNKLIVELQEDRAWELPEVESGDPNADFYLDLTIDGHHSSCHGITRAHSAVVQTLLNNPHLKSGIHNAFKWCSIQDSRVGR